MVSPSGGEHSKEEKITQAKANEARDGRPAPPANISLQLPSGALSNRQGASAPSASRLSQYATTVSDTSNYSSVASSDTNPLTLHQISMPTPTTAGGSFFLGAHNYQAVEKMDIPEFVREHNATLTFPEKLMLMLTHVEKNYEKHPPISWTLQGGAFSISNRDVLAREVLPLFFGAGKFTSFTRKLYRWGFRQISVPASSRPSNEMNFGHEYFQKDNKQLMVKMRSITAAGRRRAAQKQKQHDSASASGMLQPDQGGERSDASLKRSATNDLEKERAMDLKRTAVFYNNQRLTQQLAGTPLQQRTVDQIPAAQIYRGAPFLNPAMFQQAALSTQAQNLLQEAQQQSVLQNTQQFLLQRQAQQHRLNQPLQMSSSMLSDAQQQPSFQTNPQRTLQTAQQGTIGYTQQTTQQTVQPSQLPTTQQEQVLLSASQNIRGMQHGIFPQQHGGILENLQPQRQHPQTQEGYTPPPSGGSLASQNLASLAQASSLLEHNTAQGVDSVVPSHPLVVPGAAHPGQSSALLPASIEREDTGPPAEEDALRKIEEGKND